MNAMSKLSSEVSTPARRWAARLCLAKDATQASRILDRAFLDLGFEPAGPCCRKDRDAHQGIRELAARSAINGHETSVHALHLTSWSNGAKRPCCASDRRSGARHAHDGLARTEAGGGEVGGTEDLRFLAELYRSLHRGAVRGECEPSPEATPLNKKQIECLRWAAAGKSYSDIAAIVGISERTVRYHLDNARSVYGFATITQAIVQAAKQLDFDPLDAR